MRTDTTQPLARIERASFLAITLFLIGVILYGLSTAFLTVLFGYLIIEQLGRKLPKGLAILAFIALTSVLFYLFIHSVQQAVGALPTIAEKAVPRVLEYARRWDVEVPFSDSVSLKSYLVDEIGSQLLHLTKFAQIFTKEFVYFIIGLVVTCSIFARSEIDLGRGTYTIENNVYSSFTLALSHRFSTFFRSFRTVIGAQVVISTINTFFTGLFLLALHFFDHALPYSFVIVVVTFLCGLLPIIGNLISNTVIFFVGVSQSINLGILALSYLIILHKFEYFLNSKIIGGKIKNPMWLTLLSLLVGERLGGVPGMILAPVILQYCKLEGTALQVTAPSKNT